MDMEKVPIVCQQKINEKNSNFWDELCGTGLANEMGISDFSPFNLEKFDSEYLKMYPYLSKYYQREPLIGKKVLEIGLGYGTFGQMLAEKGCDYFGLDIAQGPVTMMKYRLELMRCGNPDNIQKGSALNIPFKDSMFDYVYSIGCLHHTGNIALAIQEISRIVKPGGKVIIMLYNKNSFRQLVEIPLVYYVKKILNKNFSFSKKEFTDSQYDTNSMGETAPYIEYVSKTQVKELFHSFEELTIDVQNFDIDNYTFLRGILVILRKILLNTFGRIAGLDLYITAIR